MFDLAAPPRPVVVVTDDTTAEDLAITLGILNDAAKAMSRRGHIGTDSADYATQHARIDAVLGDWLAKAHACPA